MQCLLLTVNVNAELNANVNANALFKGLGFAVRKTSGKFHNLILHRERHKKIQENGNKLVNILTSQNSWVVNYLSSLKNIVRLNGYSLTSSFEMNNEFSYFINETCSWSA